MPKKERQFKPSSAAESQFSQALRKVARVAGHIVEAHVDGDKIRGAADLDRALREYSKLIDPWARRQALKMLQKVEKQNSRAYNKTSKQIGRLLKEGVATGELGAAASRLMEEHVELIKSIPLEAAQRVQKLALESVYSGKRADEIAKMLADSGQVAESRADLIARTEVARATAAVNESRAVAVGSTHYRWRNSGDGAVRPAHKTRKGKPLDGKIFAWSDPPELDDGTRGHPGTFPNCRCYAEPIFEGDK